MNNKRGEISTLIIVGIILIIVAATFLTTTLNQSRQTTQTKASTGTSCDFDSGKTVPLGQTESNAANADVRWPISQQPHEYDVFGSNYFELVPNNDPTILNLTKTDDGDKNIDPKIRGFMGSMVGYKPSTVSAFDMKYDSAPQENDTDIKGQAPVLQITTNVGSFINVPKTDYSIGGNYEAMVVFAAEDRVTIHIGRHEYITSSKMCGSRKCSGGYWIYVKDICVDKQILNAYRGVEAAQRAAGADLNPIQLPMVSAGQPLGVAKGNSVTIGVRDDGPFVSTSKPFYWEGYENGAPPDGSGEQGNQGGEQGQAACMDIERVTIDFDYNNENLPITSINIKRKTNAKGGVQVGFNNKHIAGASSLPDRSDDFDEIKFGPNVEDEESAFMGSNISILNGKQIQVDTFYYEESEVYTNKAPCRSIKYSCERLRSDGYLTCTRESQTVATPPTPTPTPSQPPASQGATATPTPVTTSGSSGPSLNPTLIPTSGVSTLTTVNDVVVESDCYGIDSYGNAQFCVYDL